jgi:DNA-directed RNA polymerase subunit E'/Rpb7
MFRIHILTDIIKIPSSDLLYQTCKTYNCNDGSSSSKLSILPIIHREIDIVYPNRVLIDVGLVIGRYFHTQQGSSNDANSMVLETTQCSTSITSMNGEETHHPSKKKRHTLYPNHRQHRRHRLTLTQQQLRTQLLQNGGACEGSHVHYTVSFPVFIFRPYIGEILIGTVIDANETGMIVSLGFLASIFVPAFYMLQPSMYVPSSSTDGVWVWTPTYDDDDEEEGEEDNEKTTKSSEPLRYEMNVGSEIRVRVKAIHYTQIMATTKGRQAVISRTTDAATMAGTHNNSSLVKEHSVDPNSTQRQRSSSVSAFNDPTTSETAVSSHQPSTAMHIVASICEDGLGLTSWWKNDDDDDDDDGGDDDDDDDDDDDGDGDGDKQL